MNVDRSCFSAVWSIGAPAILMLAAVAGTTGCGPTPPTAKPASGAAPASGQPLAADSSAPPADEQLQKQLDDMLDFTFENRRLDVNEQNAWQIIHGALAYKRKFLVRAGDKEVAAVDYLLAGGKMNGWNLAPGDILDEKTGRRGVRAAFDPGSKAGQGHYDQWMGYLSDCGLKLDEKIMVAGRAQTIEDYIRQIELDVSRVALDTKEYSWTLMALTAYRPTDYEWTAADGKKWSIPQLVEMELENAVDESPCGGAHRMYGLAIARNRHLAAGGKLTGVWQKCDQRIQEQVERARQAQNADGSLSAKYFQQPAIAADITEWMGSSGHVFEFLAEALNKEELRQPWMKRAAWKLSEQFRKTRQIDVECAKLFHAAHGLVLYREKVFGPRTFPKAVAVK